jgi:hypothetical protein
MGQKKDAVERYNTLIEKVRNNKNTSIESEDRHILGLCIAAGEKVPERMDLGGKDFSKIDENVIMQF